MIIHGAHLVVTDLTIGFDPPIIAPTAGALNQHRWHRIEKDLYLHSGEKRAWLYVAIKKEAGLIPGDLVVTQVRVGERNSIGDPGAEWERRPAGIWVQRRKYTENHPAVVDLDILFGTDAVDPRPQWTCLREPLQLGMGARTDTPVARLSVRHGQAKPGPDDPHTSTPLRVGSDGKFKIVQISDTHMVTGVGVCRDAIDAYGNFLPPTVADPLTVDFIREVLDIERPDLVILTGDQVHHDILDSQSAIFKVVAPLVARSIPFAAVFGNHDAEGTHALNRASQMSLLKSLPFSLCQAGPAEVEGVVKDPDYEAIKQSQIDWFKSTSQTLRKAHVHNPNRENSSHVSLVFMHIPFPEYADSRLNIFGGQRREPTEGPSFNSHFYDALVEEGVVAVGCGHDHVNDFCGLLPGEGSGEPREDHQKLSRLGPWLCYGGDSGFGGYGSYGENRYYRRMRVWEFDTNTGSILIWKRVEYASGRVDELVLVESGVIAPPSNMSDGETRGIIIVVVVSQI
ncbi:Metallo-dependent phosphatase-like protein [Xylaria digitata]|nr:Metallo-dependent phosphatase-like protein [Xylaria digitata]